MTSAEDRAGESTPRGTEDAALAGAIDDAELDLLDRWARVRRALAGER